VKRIHSVCSAGEELYVVSTGTDSIVMFRPPDVESIYWTLDGRFEHTVHLNSICRSPDGAFLLTAFGHPGVRGSRPLEVGWIMKAPEGKSIRTGLSHPHSALFFDGRLLFCQSGKGVLSDVAGMDCSIAHGYPRGLAATRTNLYVGVSLCRNVSISTSAEMASQESERCAAIAVLSWDGCRLSTAQETHRIELGSVGAEVFDILCTQ
jgi:hypothetical protein